jgi:hypothetical protein
VFERIEELAHLSVGRGCGFAAIAILTCVVGLSDNMELALRCGGYFSLLTCMILLLKAWHADGKPYRHTELWLMIPKADRPQAAVAQAMISRCLRTAYVYFALHSAAIGAGMLLLSVLVGLWPPRSGG